MRSNQLISNVYIRTKIDMEKACRKIWSHGTCTHTASCHFACDRRSFAAYICAALNSAPHKAKHPAVFCLHFSMMTVHWPDVRESQTLNSTSAYYHVQRTGAKGAVTLPSNLWRSLQSTGYLFQRHYSQTDGYLKKLDELFSKQYTVKHLLTPA